MTDSITRVACIGAGLIGTGWAAHFLRAGLDVVAYDTDPARETYVRQTVAAVWPVLEQLGLSAGAAPDRLTFTADLDAALDGVHFVQESAVEDEAQKIGLLSQIDSRLPASAVIASSSSGFLAERLRSASKNGGRVIVGHPFNPPYLMPLVELAGGPGADPSALSSAKRFYEHTGMRAVTLDREIRGYIANRFQSAVFREALYMLDQGVASVADIDAAMAFGPARRWAFMGPSEVYFLGGGSPEGYRSFVDLLVGELAQDFVAPPDFVPSTELVERYVTEVSRWLSGATYDDLRARRDSGLIAIRNALSIERP